MKKDIKYIIKRVLISVCIILVMSFIKSCEVNAKSYYTTGYGNNSVIYTYPPSSTNIQLGNEYTTSNTITYMDLQLVSNQDDPVYPNSLTGLNNGTYLYDFYIISPSGLFSGLENCYNFTTDFAFYDSNSGSVISSSDRIKSQCVNTHYTYVNGVAAYHVLTQFTLADVGETDPQRFRFRMANYVNGFVGPNSKYRIISGNIQDYDSSIVSDFENQTQLHKQIEQNQTIINQNNQINDSINDVNDSINDSSSASNEDFNDAINSVNNALPTNSTISSLVTMPITFLQKIIDALNGTCQPIVIGELYEYNMTMPCINPVDYIGIIWNIIDIICAGFFAYYFGKKLVLLFHNITSMKEGGLKEAYD